MKTLLLVVLSISMLLSIIAGCSNPALMQDEPPKTEPASADKETPALPTPPAVLVPPPSTPKSPELIPPEERAVTYNLISEGELAQLGMPLPRQLTAQEKEKVIQSALNVEPVSEKIKQGSAYRVELMWMSYNATTDWGYYNRIDQLPQQAKSGTTFFPAADVGLGTPQQFQVNVAVDLRTGQAVFAIRRPDKHIALPPYVKPLTEQEKATIITIVSETQSVKDLGASPKIGFHWAAVSESEGTLYELGNDILEKGVPADVPLVSKSMTIYPAAIFDNGNWRVSIAVDLKTGKIMYSFPGPVNKGPVSATK